MKAARQKGGGRRQGFLAAARPLRCAHVLYLVHGIIPLGSHAFDATNTVHVITHRGGSCCARGAGRGPGAHPEAAGGAGAHARSCAADLHQPAACAGEGMLLVLLSWWWWC